jgi:hypothetical protein
MDGYLKNPFSKNGFLLFPITRNKGAWPAKDKLLFHFTLTIYSAMENTRCTGSAVCSQTAQS